MTVTGVRLKYSYVHAAGMLIFQPAYDMCMSIVSCVYMYMYMDVLVCTLHRVFKK